MDTMGPKDDPRPARSWVRRLPHWLPLPLGIGLGLAGGIGYGLVAAPEYAATSYVIVVPGHGDAQTALGFAQAYGRIVTGSAVLADARRATRVPAAVLRDGVRAATSPDAPMISITGTAGSGRTAASLANAVAASLARTGNANAASTGVRLTVFSPAVAPASPASPSAPLSGAVGASAGGLLGALALLVRPREQRADATAGPDARSAVPAPAAPAPASSRAAV